MAFDAAARPLAAGLGALLLAGAALAQPASNRGIFTCVDAHGRRLTSDRPIPACTDREQRILNADGSLRDILPPTLTAEERIAQEARERELAAERAARQDARRRDRNLLIRYPNEAAHRKARIEALDDVRKAVQLSERRLVTLAEERKPLKSESEFYVGRQLPLKLRQQLDANEAASQAQRNLIANQQAEVQRINARYDVELARLRQLWAGATPGSLGPMPEPQEVAAPAAGAASASRLN
jgi:hypothetical protein